MSATSFNPIAQREFAVDVVRKLRAAGHEAYWAGGCVRDKLLGREPKDYDVATSARPEQVRDVFSHRRTRAVGAAFGVIAVLGPKEAGMIEVATFREDAAYSDGRHPDHVTFSTAQRDAARRDFTINGLFFDPLSDRVLDFVGGQDDLRQGLVRAIGEPRLRFGEDKLRMLRAVRFAAAFEFQLEAGTLAAIRSMADELGVVSVERVAAELRLMLTPESRARAVALLDESRLLETIFPELPDLPSGDATDSAGGTFALTLRRLDALREPTFPLAMAALLVDRCDAARGGAICRRLKLSNDETARVVWLLARHRQLAGARAALWPCLQRLLTHAGMAELLALYEASLRADGCTADEAADLDYCLLMHRLPDEQLNPPPLISGDDLIAHGVPCGPEYQRLLEAARDAQLEQAIFTKAHALELVDRLLRETLA